MAAPATGIKTRFTIIPDVDHVGWHIAKEEFATQYLFGDGTTPTAKGAIAGAPGNQVWATWVHRYYGPLDAEDPSNVLYILRLVVEVDESATRLPGDAARRPPKDIYEMQVKLLRAVLQAAQAEADEWKLNIVKMWEPSPLVLDMLQHSGLDYMITEREEDSIASLQWYDQDGGVSPEFPLWVNNEHYAWQ